MSQEQKPKVCPECGGEIVKEPYEEYLYCGDCGWEPRNDVDNEVKEIVLDHSKDDTLTDFDEGDENVDLNLDPEAGESA